VELVHERAITLRDAGGVVYDRARIYGEPQDDGRWAGFLEFVPVDGSPAVRTPRETTQRNADDLAYWATGLEPVYFEGALDRALDALDRTLGDEVPEEGPIAVPIGTSNLRIANIEVQSGDPALPLRVMRTRTLTPGQRRRIQDMAALEYTGTLQSPGPAEPGRYGFLVEFGSDNAAALVANFLWSTLHAEPAAVVVGGVPVPLTNSALKEALLAAAA
jgi:hypothetical protein